MSRSGYSDGIENWDLIRWRGAVNSAIRGKRGQAMLRELLAALDAMPEKRLVKDSLVTSDGEFCTLGVLGQARGLDMAPIDPDDRSTVAETFGVAEALAAEIMFENDEAITDWKFVEIDICGPVRPFSPDWGRQTKSISVWDDTAGFRRWSHMRNWVAASIKPAA